MSNKCHNTALKTRARTREDLEGPAHGGPRTPVRPQACIYLPSRRARCLSSSAPLPPGEKRPEKAEAKTDQGSLAAAGGVKAVGVKEEADRARFSVPLWRSPPRRRSQSPGVFTKLGLPGVPGLVRAQRAAWALMPPLRGGERAPREVVSGKRVGGMHFTVLKEKGVDHAHVDHV